MSGRTPLWRLNELVDLDFDAAQCWVELAEFEELLARRPELSERRDILPFFRARPHLAAFLGSYNPNLITFDRLAFELSLFGEFTADVVVGDWDRKSFCFVEFEDATADSIFVQGGRRAREWAGRFEHGFSQIVDWFWKLDDLRGSVTFERLFGARTITFMALLVVGRNHGVTAEDWPRLRWRREQVVVNSKHIYCCTFDELYRDLRQRLDRFTAAANGE